MLKSYLTDSPIQQARMRSLHPWVQPLSRPIKLQLLWTHHECFQSKVHLLWTLCQCFQSNFFGPIPNGFTPKFTFFGPCVSNPTSLDPSRMVSIQSSPSLDPVFPIQGFWTHHDWFQSKVHLLWTLCHCFQSKFFGPITTGFNPKFTFFGPLPMFPIQLLWTHHDWFQSIPLGPSRRHLSIFLRRQANVRNHRRPCPDEADESEAEHPQAIWGELL